MLPERFQQIEELYHAARGKSPEERAVLLAQADPEVRREAESLLAQRSGEDFLERPAIQSTPQRLDDSTLTGSAVGASLGPYRIEGRLGEGGMGEVYRAVDTRLGRAVAIKTIRERFSARFEREARAIASLNHPHICTLYDVGPNYLVMELLEGETIAARLQGGALPAETAVIYAAQILSALAEAHEKGIIHRDLKPGNIMIAKSGVKVLDFGLAKSSRDETMTASHMVLGTLAYMAPEQRQGRPADARSDIYSFGCVFYEMLTNTRFSHQRQRISSRKLERIVSRCLEEDPARRWQSVAELEQELSGISAVTGRGGANAAAGIGADAQRDSEPSRAARATAERRLDRTPGRHRAAFRIAAGIAVPAVLLAGVWLFRSRRPHALTDKDTIVLADFVNTTGDPVFDGTLRQGLSVQLEQSPFLSVVSDDQIQQTLRMMGRQPEAKLTPATAEDLCQRVGSAAVIEGSIAQIGAPYLLTVKAVNCANGVTLASTEAQAGDKNQVLEALGKAASAIRGKLGESLDTVQRFDTPLEQATTTSLEALKAYSSGHELMSRAGGAAAAIPLFKQATELDPNFAAAYAWLGIQYTSIGEPATAIGYTRRAYELRDRTSQPEKYFISAVYYKEVTGDILKAVETCKLWMQAYPRAEMPHTYLAGAIYPILAENEKGLEESRESVRLSPDYSVPYAFAMDNATCLNRLDEAKAAYREAVTRKLQTPFFPYFLYPIAFLERDPAAMSQQVAMWADEPAVEGDLLSMESETAAYSGRLQSARKFSDRAVQAAEQAGEKEVAATYFAQAALREALFGNRDQARQYTAQAIKRSPGVDALFASALALAYSGDDEKARALAADLDRRYPEATLVQSNYLPTLRAELATRSRKASEAIEHLRAAAPYELGQSSYSVNRWTSLYPVYVRGQAYLAEHRGKEAAAEFQKILDHWGIVVNEPIGALAHLQLGRAYALEAQSSQGADAAGARARARAEYLDFLALWKDADPDIPVLKQAKAEYASLR